MTLKPLQLLTYSISKTNPCMRELCLEEKVFYNAPTMFLIPIKEGGELDCGIVCQNITLAAHSLGLGSVICGMARLPFDGKEGQELKERIGFPEGYKFGMSVLVGYPATSGTPHEPDRGKISFID